jgi:hypothetical protein
MRSSIACSANGGEKDCIKAVDEKARKKEPLEKPRRRCVDYTKMDLREVAYGSMDWIGLA